MNTAAIILAAGKGERVAGIGAKPLLKFKGKTFLETSVDKAQKANFKPLIAVTSEILYDQINRLDLNIEILINPYPEKGMLSSLLCGLEILNQTVAGFLLNPVDFPLVEQNTYQKLWISHQTEKNCIIKPTYNGRSGHPVIFPATVFENLKKAPLNKGAKAVLQEKPDLVRKLAVDDAGILLNINTPELYFKYCC